MFFIMPSKKLIVAPMNPKETFELAKDRNLPILLSIGYASCHWCQKMSRECFRNSFVASLMNRHFICIIVDREERPDLDQIYLESVRMFNQTAGWPLNIFCLPNGHPFWGGTFFPKKKTMVVGLRLGLKC